MRILITSIFVILIAITIFSLIKMRSLKDENTLNLTHLLGFNIILCLMQILFMYSTSEQLSGLFTGIYTAITYWYLACLSFFVMSYTSIGKYFTQLKVIIIVFGLLDSALMLTNNLHHMVFRLMPLNVWGMDIYRVINSSRIFNVHVVACALLSMFCVFALGRKFFLAKGSFTRGKFSPVFFITSFTVIFALVVMLFHFYIDFSVVLYSLLANAICVLNYNIVPVLVRSQARALVVQKSRSAVFFYDGDCKKIYSNPAADNLEKTIDISPLIDKYLSDIVEGNFNSLHHSEISLVTDSAERLFNISCRKIVEGNEIIGYSLQFTDVTDEVNQRKESIRQMTHDDLTGLYNHSYFCRQVEEFISHKQADSYYIIVSDILGFKFYNYIFGRQAGDDALLYMANLMQSLATEHSVYGRLSDDEFGLFIEGDYYNEDIIKDCILKMRNEFSNSRYKININAGVYHVTDPTISVELMCDRAKLAINAIKNDYNLIISHYDAQISEDILAKQWILDELDSAIENNQFVMFLQPQIDITTNKWIGAEALVRWIHPERGIIAPAMFIPILEEAAVITRVDMQIWEQAAAKLAEWKAKGREDMYISVNVSGHDFFHTNLFEVFSGLVSKYDINPANLKIEITETVLAYSREHKNTILSQLREAGFTIEVDDFGSGYSSLNFLKDMESDVIKIDMGFLRKSVNNDRSKVIFNDVVHMIQDIDMEIIVEGIETAEQLEFVQAAGCNYIQGYYFSRPISVDDFENKMK